MVRVPAMLLPRPEPLPLKAIAESKLAFPALSILPLVKVKLVTATPLTPLSIVVLINIRSKEGLVVLFSEIPIAALWIDPPVHVATDEQLPPLPLTVRLPVAPVVFRMIPLVAPFEVMLRNVRPAAPMVVFATLSAVPVVVASVFKMVVFFCVAVTVPPPVAAKAAFVAELIAMPPVKLIVAPVFVARLIPVPVPPTAPLSATDPPLLLATLTCLPPLLLIVPEKVIAAVPPLTSRALPVAPLSAPPLSVMVPFNPTRFTFFAPPDEVVPPRTTLTVGAPTPVRSSAPPLVLIVIVLTFSVPTFAPVIAVPPVQLPISKPESMLLPGAPDSETQLPAVLVVVGLLVAVNNVMVLTTKLTP